MDEFDAYNLSAASPARSAEAPDLVDRESAFELSESVLRAFAHRVVDDYCDGL